MTTEISNVVQMRKLCSWCGEPEGDYVHLRCEHEASQATDGPVTVHHPRFKRLLAAVREMDTATM